MKSITLLFTFLLACLFCTAQNNPDSLSTKMDAIFESYNHLNSPGCAVSIIKDGKVIFEKGYGLANLEFDISITPTTIFDIASLSKQFTGMAISTLIQEGKISLDDDIHKYLPEVPQFGKSITIRNLLHHTSGIRDWTNALHIAGWRYDEIFSFEDIMRMVKYQKQLDFEPGSNYSYSNTGYNLLAAIVKKVTGKSLGDWEEENIFKPLGMNSSFILDNYKKVIKNRATSYSPDGSGFGISQGALTAYGSSSIFTSVEDLSKWVINFQNAIASKDPVYTRMLEEDILNNKEKVHYGYGLEINEERGVKTISHDGGWQGYRTIISNYPDEKFSLIILSNVSSFDPIEYSSKIASLFLKDKLKPAPIKENLKDSLTVKVDTSLIKKYIGSYQLGPGWYVTFTLEDGQLYVQANGENKFPAIAKSDSVFWVQAYGSSMTFVKDINGEINSLKYRSIRAKRIIPIKVTPAQLNQYSGTYFSEELESVFKMYVVNGKLVIQNMRLGDFTLKPDPVNKDQFSCSLGTLSFFNDKQLNVKGFKLTGGRARNIQFDKK